MSLRLVAIRATEPGVCVVEFDRGGGEPVICTGSAEELRQIIRVIVAVSQLSAREGSS
jgi:hypothetical protein